MQVCCHFSVRRLKTRKIILLFRSVLPKRILSLPSKKQKTKTIFEAPHAKTEDKRHRKILLTITKLKKIIMKRYYFFFLSNISYCLIHLCEALERSIWNSFPISSHIFSEILKKNSLEYYSWKGFKVVDLNDKKIGNLAETFQLFSLAQTVSTKITYLLWTFLNCNYVILPWKKWLECY